MTLTVAVTRPEPQASATAKKLRAQGDTPVLAPLMTLEPAHDWGSAAGIGAIALTSRTTARLLRQVQAFHTLPTYCVGDATAAEAHAAGAAEVISAAGDVEDLLRILADAPEPVLHFCGADHRGHLVERLRRAGKQAERRIVYTMRAATALPSVSGRLDAVLLYSPRTATIFRDLATSPPWPGTPAVALSPAVAQALYDPARAVVAAAPNEASLFRALDTLRPAGG